MAGLVKHYQNTMKGIPQLSNAWGSMINLLDAVLVNGFNHVPVISISKSTPTAITATIHLGSGHGFIDRQVVRITGSTNGWDGDYRVLSACTNTITIECTDSHSSALNGTATCFTAPLDFEIAHQTPTESTTPKRAYRSTDPESLGLILLVHDFCSPGAAAAGAKFAKVGVVSGMTDINNITGVQMPYNPAKPNSNWEWDGEYHGWAKWYYRTADHGGPASSSNDDVSVSTIINSSFLVVGDGSGFSLDVTVSNTGLFLTYGYLEFLDARNNTKNLALLAAGLQIKTKQRDSIVAHARSGIRLGGHTVAAYGGLNLNAAIWFDATGSANYELAGQSIYLGQGNNKNASVSASSNVFFVPFMLTVGDNYIGYLPFIKSTANSSNVEGVSNIGKYVTRYSMNEAILLIKHGYTLEQR
ncbi:hypothetical protein MTX11_13745 [Acinetobacter lwoffii]|uniref:hypothetical protein n=1 Tax=Acinetobacter lwoffii TaxID=28090 RepID=UPI001FB1CCC5|nr:hypothetical protein [Acinetobacter lwoffii]MCJ0929016.1 hypothetical protein [Acinetobacter lwoffii]